MEHNVKRTSPEERRHAEIRDLELVTVVEQQVLGLDVAVRHAAAVQVRQPAQQLAPVAPRLLLAHAHVGLDAVEQLAARRVLQEHVVQALVRALAQAAQHVRVAQRAVQRRLARRPRTALTLTLGRAAHHLQRHGGAAARVHQQPHSARQHTGQTRSASTRITDYERMRTQCAIVQTCAPKIQGCHRTTLGGGGGGSDRARWINFQGCAEPPAVTRSRRVFSLTKLQCGSSSVFA